MIYKDRDGQEVWLEKDLTIALKAHTAILKRYYRLAVYSITVGFVVLMWLIWQIKAYKIITRIIMGMG